MDRRVEQSKPPISQVLQHFRKKPRFKYRMNKNERGVQLLIISILRRIYSNEEGREERILEQKTKRYELVENALTMFRVKSDTLSEKIYNFIKYVNLQSKKRKKI
jgi:hypothetical protein